MASPEQQSKVPPSEQLDLVTTEKDMIGKAVTSQLLNMSFNDSQSLVGFNLNPYHPHQSLSAIPTSVLLAAASVPVTEASLKNVGSPTSKACTKQMKQRTRRGKLRPNSPRGKTLRHLQKGNPEALCNDPHQEWPQPKAKVGGSGEESKDQKAVKAEWITPRRGDADATGFESDEKEEQDGGVRLDHSVEGDNLYLYGIRCTGFGPGVNRAQDGSAGSKDTAQEEIPKQGNAETTVSGPSKEQERDRRVRLKKVVGEKASLQEGARAAPIGPNKANTTANEFGSLWELQAHDREGRLEHGVPEVPLKQRDGKAAGSGPSEDPDYDGGVSLTAVVTEPVETLRPEKLEAIGLLACQEQEQVGGVLLKTAVREAIRKHQNEKTDAFQVALETSRREMARMQPVQAAPNQHSSDNQNGSDSEERSSKATGARLTEKPQQVIGDRLDGGVSDANPQKTNGTEMKASPKDNCSTELDNGPSTKEDAEAEKSKSVGFTTHIYRRSLQKQLELEVLRRTREFEEIAYEKKRKQRVLEIASIRTLQGKVAREQRVMNVRNIKASRIEAPPDQRMLSLQIAAIRAERAQEKAAFKEQKKQRLLEIEGLEREIKLEKALAKKSRRKISKIEETPEQSRLSLQIAALKEERAAREKQIAQEKAVAKESAHSKKSKQIAPVKENAFKVTPSIALTTGARRTEPTAPPSGVWPRQATVFPHGVAYGHPPSFQPALWTVQPRPFVPGTGPAQPSGSLPAPRFGQPPGFSYGVGHRQATGFGIGGWPRMNNRQGRRNGNEGNRG